MSHSWFLNHIFFQTRSLFSVSMATLPLVPLPLIDPFPLLLISFIQKKYLQKSIKIPKNIPLPNHTPPLQNPTLSLAAVSQQANLCNNLFSKMAIVLPTQNHGFPFLAWAPFNPLSSSSLHLCCSQSCTQPAGCSQGNDSKTLQVTRKKPGN